MKLKIGTLTIERETLLKWMGLFLVQGILIGIAVAAKQDGHDVTAPFIVANVMLIPALARRLFRDKNTGEKL